MTDTITLASEIIGAPQPTLVISGTHATISGIRYQWSCRCWRCRTITYVFTDGGSIRAGMTVSASRKTCRWYQTERPVPPRELPATCAHCGESSRPFGSPGLMGPLSEPRRAHDVRGLTLPLLDQVWGTMRAQYPAQARKADVAAGIIPAERKPAACPQCGKRGASADHISWCAWQPA